MTPTRPTISLTRQELYDKVWATAVSRLAGEFGLSDVGLRKICQRYDIPLPPLGYWAKKQHGKKVTKTPLPKLDSPDEDVIEFWLPEEGQQVEPVASEAVVRCERERLPENRIHVPETLDAPHPFIERTQRSLASAKPDENGLVRPRAKRCLDVVVSPSSVDRAMLIMDALVKGLEQRGLVTRFGNDHQEGMKVEVLGESIAFRLEEGLDRSERPLTPEEKREVKLWGYGRSIPRYSFSPSGQLALRILVKSTGVHCRWGDNRRRSLERVLNAFVGSFFKVAEALKHQRAEDERRRQEWAAAEERRRIEAERQRQEEARRREEERRLRELEDLVDRWHRARKIRDFLDFVEQAVINKYGELERESELGRWLGSSRELAQSLDPVRV